MRTITCLLIFAMVCTSESSEGAGGTGGSAECTDGVGGSGGPPKNPFLADSIYGIPDGDSAQQDSTSLAGPTGPTKRSTISTLRTATKGSNRRVVRA